MAADETISADELNVCVKILSRFNSKKDFPLFLNEKFDEIRPLVRQLGQLQKQVKKKRSQERRNRVKLIDRKTRNSCLLRTGRAEKLQQLQLEHLLIPDGPVSTNSSSFTPQRLRQPIVCYICKLKYRTLHFFYDRLCPACAKLNFEKRIQTTDLSNHVALVTGGRVKIGYRVVLKLLQAKCFVIATSRFPMDLLNRLKQERDFEQWNERIHIYGIDLRFPQLIERFTEMIIHTYPRLDFLINNACQTIQRPKEFYQHLVRHERLNLYPSLPNIDQQILNGHLQFYQQFCPLSYQISSDSSQEIIPAMSFDVHQQPIDLRSTNSWILRLGDLSTNEVNEVLTINTLAPFILNSQLKVLMADRHPTPDSPKFIINVSAMEGSFSRRNKTDRHPHTNAAKAALNMMTQTSASDYQKSNIYMSAIDTGWINDEKPLDRAFQHMTQHDFQTPLDEEDAAARILDPIFNTYQQLTQGQTNINIPYGCFLKNYHRCDW